MAVSYLAVFVRDYHVAYLRQLEASRHGVAPDHGNNNLIQVFNTFKSSIAH